ncbi:MAG TPA: single-stranded-DNA-specific exonuclease RecJ [Planctomycetota bacterium]|nr:single-stranded-DNA-specific exonuclease RecJ [Planctomycetota bacterium]
MANILVNRGIVDEKAASLFLNPQLRDLLNPFLLPDIDKAAERIRQAALANQKVVVYGDYDVDGTAGVALLVQFFKLLNMDVSYYVPHRIKEGYGLNVNAIRQFTSDDVQLLITVDCGINAVDEINSARGAGIDIIITDHHEPGPEIPQAYAVINPKLPDSPYPFRHLSGVGVAFKLVWALAQKLSGADKVLPEFRDFLKDALGLVGLGTIADVVPLIGENRVLAKFGLEALKNSRSPGVRALIESAGLDRMPLSSHHVSFRLAPRLNAAGRMAEASLCVELLTTDSTERARQIAAQLDESNRERQQIQSTVLNSVREKINQEIDLRNEMVVVLADQNWHAGVLGIVASKVVDDYYRPTVLVALEKDVGKGSGRSIPQFNLFDALTECEDKLISFGGHSQAAGIKIRHDNIEAFRGALNAYAAARLDHADLVCSLDIEAEVALDELTDALVSDLDKLAPHGEGNRPPVFCSRGVRVVGSPRLVGREDRHVAFYARQSNASFRSIAMGMADLYEQFARRQDCDLAFKVKHVERNGLQSVELDVVDIKFKGTV